MPKGEFNGAIFFRCDAEMEATLREMQRHQKTVPVALARGLLEEACKFYRENGYFHFPIMVGPKFQLMVAEPPAPEAGGSPQGSPTRPGAGLEVDHVYPVRKKGDSARAKSSRRAAWEIARPEGAAAANKKTRVAGK